MRRSVSAIVVGFIAGVSAAGNSPAHAEDAPQRVVRVAIVLAVNLKTAKDLGLTIPEAILLRADE